MARKSYHAKNGRFTSFNRANVVNQDGERFKMVRTLEPLDAPEKDDKTSQPDASTAENVAQAKQKVSDLAGRIAPQWISLDEVVR
ncbi:MAG: hypothetical protein JRG69_07790 [Deltaproteobacteria bacterium]|nr:hypothetical protein [Deltaproteobacteria bacterium]